MVGDTSAPPPPLVLPPPPPPPRRRPECWLSKLAPHNCLSRYHPHLHPPSLSGSGIRWRGQMPSLRTETATTAAVATTAAADMKSPLPPAPLFSCSPCVVAACTDLAPAASAPAAWLVSPPLPKLLFQRCPKCCCPSSSLVLAKGAIAKATVPPPLPSPTLLPPLPTSPQYLPPHPPISSSHIPAAAAAAP